MENQAKTLPNARGGKKTAPLHVGLLILSTLLLTVAGLFLVYDYNAIGVLALIVGIAVRFLDSKL